MRTNNILKHLALGVLLLSTVRSMGQVSTPSNVALGPTDFLGWNNNGANANLPLRVRHDLNQPIEWYTNAVQRMLLAPTVTGQTVNGYPGVNLTGFLGIGPFGNALVNQPQAMLHLDGGGTQDSGWRPWMKQGTYITYTSDQAYLGLKEESGGRNHLTLAWSDNGLLGEPDGPDQLRFIFTRNNVGSTLAAGIHGLEAGRFTPASSCNEVFFGLGHWQGTGLNPVDRLHLLNGRIRVTQLPTDAPANAMTKVLVVDDSFTPEYGVIKWRDISTIQDCEWQMNTSMPNHVYTAVGASDPDCPDQFESVGIGVDLSTTTAQAKLEVYTQDIGIAARIANEAADNDVRGVQVNVMNGTTSNRGFSAEVVADGNAINYGLRADVSGSTVRSRGVSAQTSGASYTAYAGEFLADDEAEFTTGVIGWARGGGLRIGSDGRALGSKATYQIGVQGLALPELGCEVMAPLLKAEYIGVSGIACREDDDPTIVGVYGRTMDDGGGTWAGYFDGHVNITGLAFCTLMQWGSDADLKTDVQDITGAMGLIDQLRPTTFLFDTVAHPALDLPGGLQRGFIAQEVEQVLPDLVRETTYLGRSDSLGNTVLADESVKTVNYIGFIPLLVAAMQEQQTTITTLQDQLAAVQQDLATCCAAHGSTDGRGMSPGAGAGEALRTDLFIVPNPVADHTQLRYTVAAPGRTRLEVSDAGGHRLEVLEEAVREVGAYTHDWATTGLAPGTYHVTLYLNDSFVVKKAVKVAR